jgi:hypothetical protein
MYAIGILLTPEKGYTHKKEIRTNKKKNHEKLNNGEIPAFDDGETITNRAIC